MAIKTTKEVRDLQILLEIAKAMSSEKDLGALLALIAASATRVLGAERSSILLVDEEKKELWSRVAEGTGFREIRFPMDKGIAGHVATTGEPLNVPDAYQDPRFNPEIDRRTGFKTRSILCMPMRNHEGTIVGVTEVLNKKDASFTLYDEWLLEALASHAAIALEGARLVDSLVEKKRMEEGLKIARQIQQSLLPTTPPEIPGFDIAGSNINCEETGGDYFDFIPLDGKRVAIVVGDVTGHGVGAALLMATSRSSLRALATGRRNLGEMMARLNGTLERDMGDGRFITLFYCILGGPDKPIRYTSAGHDPPLILRGGGQEVDELDSTGPPLGMMPEMEFGEQQASPLRVGDLLLIGTDGIWEATNPKDEQFGRERLLRVLKVQKEEPAAAILEAVLDSMRAFTQTECWEDDVTLVVVKRI